MSSPVERHVVIKEDHGVVAKGRGNRQAHVANGTAALGSAMGRPEAWHTCRSTAPEPPMPPVTNNDGVQSIWLRQMEFTRARADLAQDGRQQGRTMTRSTPRTCSSDERHISSSGSGLQWAWSSRRSRAPPAGREIGSGPVRGNHDDGIHGSLRLDERLPQPCRVVCPMVPHAGGPLPAGPPAHPTVPFQFFIGI